MTNEHCLAMLQRLASQEHDQGKITDKEFDGLMLYLSKTRPAKAFMDGLAHSHDCWCYSCR